MLVEVPKMKMITPSILSDRLRINGSLARARSGRSPSTPPSLSTPERPTSPWSKESRVGRFRHGPTSAASV